MQLPIRDNISFKLLDVNKNTNPKNGIDTQKESLLSQVRECNALTDQNNPIISQVKLYITLDRLLLKNV
jgi:hypothetical protein